MFGQQSNKPFAFGGSTFGQQNTAFGQPQTSVFGQTSTFGTPATTQQSGGLFGTPQQTGGLFGQTTQSAFGQAPQQQQQTPNTSFSFGGAQQTPQPSLFGQQTTQQNATPNAFGGGAFGAQANRPTFGGFGATTTAPGTAPATGGLFGTQGTNAPGGLFGNVTSSTTGGSVFGGGSSAFGGVGVTVGTTIPFKVVTGTDTMMKNGTTQNIQTQHQCISCMKEYENKSLEELRVEDYMANRKQGSQTAGGAFGTTTQNATGGGLFGGTGGGFSFGNTATQNKPLFGGTTSGFGATTTQSTTTFGQPNTVGAAPFGAPASSAPSMFGATTTTTGGFGGFGAAQKPAFGGFGTTPATTTQQGGTGAFGAKPFGTTGGFGMGTGAPFGANTGGIGAQTGAKPGGLGFGATQTGFNMTSGVSAFGAPAASSTGFSFGTTTTTASTSLFGGKSTTAGGFGTTTPFSFGGATTGFGATSATSVTKPFGSFGTPAQPSFGAGLGGSFNTTGTMFGQPQQPIANTPTQNLESIRAQQLVLMTSIPLAGSDSFFKVDQKKDQLRPTSLASQKAVIEDITVKPRTMPITKVKVTPVNLGTGNLSNSSLFDGLEDKEVSPLKLQNSKSFTIKPKSPPNNVLSLSFFDMPLNSPTAETRRDSIGTAALNTSAGPPDTTVGCTPLRGTSGTQESGGAGSGSSNRQDVRGGANTTIGEDDTSLLHRSSNLDQTVLGAEVNKDNENRVGISLRRPGYYTKPALSSLRLDAKGQCWVEDFTVGRNGYGLVVFPGKMDVHGLDLDSTVLFRRNEITVYPDESKKPPLGQGLNRRAEVSLDEVYPVRKSTSEKELITNPEELMASGWRQRLERYTVKMGAKFLDYDENIGRWSFRVEHFSRYGLLDDSDDDEVEMVETRPLPQQAATLQTQQQQQQQQYQQQQQQQQDPLALAVASDADRKQAKMASDEDLDRMMQVTMAADKMLPDSYFLSPTSFQMSHSTQMNVGDLQGIKASLFMNEMDDDEEEAFRDRTKNDAGDQWIKQTHARHQAYPIKTYGATRLVDAALKPMIADQQIDDAPLDGKGFMNLKEIGAPSGMTVRADRLHQPVVGGVTGFSSKKPAVDVYEEFISKFDKFPTVRPEADPLQKHHTLHTAARFEVERVPAESSIFTTIGANVFPNELAGFNRLRMRPSLHQWALARLSDKTVVRPLNIAMLGHTSGASSVSLEKVNFRTEIEPLTELMSVELNNSNVSFDSNGLPLYTPTVGVTLLQDHIRRLADQEGILETELLNTLKLCDALWGDGVPDSTDTIQMEASRKRALSVWITAVMKDVVAQEVASADNPLQAIISLLSGHQIAAACDEAVSQGDYNLATLIAQAGHDQTTKHIAKSMCLEWTETQIDQMIDAERLRVYALLAGYPRWTLSDGTEVNVCTGLDWLRCFALHLWYICPSNMSIAEVLAEYEQAAQQYATNPEVKYAQEESADPNRQNPLHVCFQLIRLFTDSSQTVEKILCPDTVLSVHSQLEYRHCWLLGLVLQSLEYQVPCAEELHVRMACQLESLGLWQWAVFALLHIRNPQRRQKIVYDLICRHVTASVDLSDTDCFIANTLKVPRTLIYKAKALRASFEGRRVNQTKLLILADELNEAHEVLSNNLAVKAIINEQYTLLGDLLQKMRVGSVKIPNWNQRGRVYLHYIQLTTLLKEVLAAKDDEKAIERILSGSDHTLESVLASLTSKIARLPSATVEQRLCQIEMSKTTYTAYKTVLTVKSMSDPHLKNSAVRAICQLLRKLALPEDTVAQEFVKLSEEYPEYLPTMEVS